MEGQAINKANPTSIRLTEVAENLLDCLRDFYGINRGVVIETAVRILVETEGLEVPGRPFREDAALFKQLAGK